ncbi:MAG: hypothetical protein KJS92_08935, partial [Bacteroidetes bacterium]|nr:hypothetical protein [Bacteroidota bacterium]
MKQKAYYLQIVTLTLMLSGIGLYSLLEQKNTVSLEEKRKLTPMPAYSWHSLKHGAYTDSLELYYADNFPWRQQFLNTAFALQNARGLKSEEVSFYSTEKKPGVSAPHLKQETQAKDSGDDASLTAEVSKGLIIYNNMAMQVFGGSEKMAKACASSINTFAAALPPGVKAYCMVAPTAGEFYMPASYRKMARSEKDNIATIYNNLNASVTPVDAITEMSAHTGEYLYFNTDHHWTALGAYYAYRATCEKMGLIPNELASMPKKTINGFLGSLYWLTRDPKLLEKKDFVDYYQVPGEYTTSVYTKTNPNKPLKSSLLAGFASGANAYSVFLGGDYPLMRISTNAESGRKLLIIKNSYGNPYSVF